MIGLNGNCPRCGALGKVVAAGVAHSTGKAYDAFMACETCRIDGTDKSLSWKSERQWQYHADMAELARRVIARGGVSPVPYVRPKSAAPAGRDVRPADNKVRATKPAPKKAPPKKPTAATTEKKPPSPAVLKIIRANAVIEALNALDDDLRSKTMKSAGYDAKVNKSYVLWVNGLADDPLTALAALLGVQ